MSDIFISHVEEDADVALEIALGLEEAGYSTWCYELDGIPGASYLLQTGQAVADSTALVVVISPHSVGSRQVTSEIVRAHESDKDFIPVRRGITHIEFQNRQPEWREAIGAATSVGIPQEGAASILPRIIAGLRSLDIQPTAKPDSVRIEQIRKALSELRAQIKKPELGQAPAEAAAEKARPAVSGEKSGGGAKAATNLRWVLAGGILLGMGFIILIAGTAGYSPLTEGLWYESYYWGLLAIALPFIAIGAYCLRRGIAQARVSKLAQAKIPGRWWLLPIFLGPIGGTIAWLKQRDIDWRKASNFLTLGIVLSVLWMIPFLAAKVPFEPTLYALTTGISPSGAGSVSPSSGEYESGVQVTLTASPASGYTFDHWSGSASGIVSTIVITMDSDKSITAHFEAGPEILFSDDFSDESSGWSTQDNSDGQISYRDGCLHIKDYTDGYFILGQSHHYFTDFILEVETWLVGGTNDNLHIVLCRYRDEDNFYALGIGADGWYELWAAVDGNGTYAVVPTYSAYIHQGVGAVNSIRAEVAGSTISVSVNGHLLWEGTDAAFTGGDIALGASAQAGSFTEVAFDNVKVYSLD